MKRIAFPAALLAASVLAPAAPTVAQVDPGQAEAAEAAIPFAHLGRTWSWRPDGRDAVYIQGRGRQWYRASFVTQCFNLPWANRLGVEARATRTLQRGTVLVVEGERCMIASLVRVDGPPEERG